MIVVDTNIVAYLFLDGDKHPQARRVLERDPHWRTSPLWVHEFCNTLTKHHKAGLLTREECERALSKALAAIRPTEQPIAPHAALRTAIDFGITSYDAEYLALAIGLGVRCVTEDRRLRDAARDHTWSMEEFLAS